MALETIVTGNLAKPDLSRAGIADLVDRLRATDRVVEVPVQHRFTPGLYIREVMVPANTAVITHVHKTAHPFVVSKGRIFVWTKNGGVVFLEAPFTGITEPGTCRLAVASEDTVWTTFHPNPTNETDVEKLEKMLVWTPREAASLEERELKCLSLQ